MRTATEHDNWDQEKRLKKGLRAFFAVIGIGVLMLEGFALAEGMRPLIDVSSVRDVFASLWQLLKGITLVGAGVSLMFIWAETVEQRQTKEYLERRLRGEL